MFLLLFTAFLLELSDASRFGKKPDKKESSPNQAYRELKLRELLEMNQLLGRDGIVPSQPIPIPIASGKPSASEERLIPVPSFVEERRRTPLGSRDSSNPRSGGSSNHQPGSLVSTMLLSSPGEGLSALEDLPYINDETWHNLICLNTAWGREDSAGVCGSGSGGASGSMAQLAAERSENHSNRMETFSYHASMHVTNEGNGWGRHMLEIDTERSDAACKEAASLLLSPAPSQGSCKSLLSPTNSKKPQEVPNLLEMFNQQLQQQKQEKAENPAKASGEHQTTHQKASHEKSKTEKTEGTMSLKKPTAVESSNGQNSGASGSKSPARKAKAAPAAKKVEEEEKKFNSRIINYGDIIREIKKPRSNSDLSLNSGKEPTIPAGVASRNPSADSTPKPDGARKGPQHAMPMSYKSALTESLQMTSSEQSSKSEAKAGASNSLHDKPSPPVPSLPTMPFSEWSLLFRLPSSMKPLPGGRPQFFPFSRCENTDEGFLQQLKEFRRKLRATSQEDAGKFKFVDYVPFFDPAVPLHRQNPHRLVTAPPLKIFSEAPSVQWTPIRCDLMGFEFEVTGQFSGREAKAGRKSILQYVRNVNDPNDQAIYVRKTYNVMEYFLNELNFFQHVDSQFIVKPICIEPNLPAIVMQRFNGRRIHEVMFETVPNMYNYYGSLTKAWEETVTIMARLFAKLMVAIAQIHNLGFIHCDIKPENILYDQQSGHIVLIDFDLSVTAPYIFSNRGTATTVAPEAVGLLAGPVHFGVDWWGFGNTATIIIAWALAGVYHVKGQKDAEKRFLRYVPFAYNYREMSYVMTPIPSEFPPLMREFLYPFFSPYPAHRVFSETDAFEWIAKQPFLKPVKNIYSYFEDSGTNSMTKCFIKLRSGPLRLTKRPHREFTCEESKQMLHRFISAFKQRLKPARTDQGGDEQGESGSESGSGEEEDDDDDEEEETGSEEDELEDFDEDDSPSAKDEKS